MWNMIASLKAVGEGLAKGLTNAITVLLPLLVLMGMSFGAGWLGSGITDAQADLQRELNQARMELNEATKQIAELQEVVAELQRPNSDTGQPNAAEMR